MKYNQICFKTAWILKLRTIRVLVTQGWGLEYANILTNEPRSGYSKCSNFTICHLPDFWTLRLSSLKEGYKSSDQKSWRLKTKLLIRLIGTTWFNQYWSSAGYNSDFWNSHPFGAHFPKLWSNMICQPYLADPKNTERIN